MSTTSIRFPEGLEVSLSSLSLSQVERKVMVFVGPSFLLPHADYELKHDRIDLFRDLLPTDTVTLMIPTIDERWYFVSGSWGRM